MNKHALRDAETLLLADLLAARKTNDRDAVKRANQNLRQAVETSRQWEGPFGRVETPDMTARTLLEEKHGPTGTNPTRVNITVRSIAQRDLDLADSALYRHVVWESVYEKVASMLRVSLTGAGVVVVLLDRLAIDEDIEGIYDDVDLLPDWVKERLAVLMIIDPTPPTPSLPGVGRRISKYVFWVEIPST